MANKRSYKRKPEEQRNIAIERIKVLMDKANDAFEDDKALANRYVSLARKISMKYKVRFPAGLKRQFCKHCYSFMKIGANCRVRIQKERVIYYCLECKRFMRFPCKKKSKKLAR